LFRQGNHAIGFSGDYGFGIMAMEKTSFGNLISNIKSWSLSRKLSLVAISLLSILLFAAIILQANRAEYRPLYTELSQEEAASVTNWLKEQNVSYQLKNGGRSIYVPAAVVYETRLNLAGAGLPKQGGMGFEIFDKQGFGVTNFTQKINYQRALQGELARTISALEAVKSARVHLVIPEKRLFNEQQKHAKASVVLDLNAGHSLNTGQIQGIIHLVAGSVEWLDKNMVTVVDTTGQTLSQSNGNDLDQMMLPERLKFKNTLEANLEMRAQSLLDLALGNGNAIVRVTTDLDFTQEAITKEEYDPDGVVPRSEKITGSESGVRQTGGVPGVEANLGGNAAIDGSIPSIQSSEITNYEISKTVKQIINPVGKIKNISAAVLLAEQIKPGEKAGEGIPVPFSEAETEAIKRMMITALGIDFGRGDKIEVVSMPFKQNKLEISEAGSGSAINDFIPYLKYLLLFVCAVLLYRILIRPMVKTLQGESIMHNKTVRQLEHENVQEIKALDPPARLRQELEEKSVTPTQVIKAWLKEG
jgi:flagellar M-ring protein FliF